MADLGEKLTEKREAEIKEELARLYKEAEKDLNEKVRQYTNRYRAEDKRKRELLRQGKLTNEQYKAWQRGQVFIGDRWNKKVAQMARSLVAVEKTAVEIVHGGQIDCLASNANYFEYRIDKDHQLKGNFYLYDESTVTRLVTEQPELLQRRVVDGVKCEAWNQKVIYNCITQGIIQGESIPDIAKRMARDTASTDMKAMVRYARTAMTGAQNSGRLLAMRNSTKLGIKVRKIWIATDDDRTRDAHVELNGQIQDIDVPFDSELGEIMYPGDPSASAENVWNCRCALGYEYPAGSTAELDTEESAEELEEWEDEHTPEPAPVKEPEPPKTYKGYDLIQGEHSIEDDLLAVNPQYSTKDPMYTNNCGNCSFAYDARRRGIDVTAKGRDGMYLTSWKTLWKDFKPVTVSAKRKAGARKEIEDMLLKAGEGARVSIFGVWDGKKWGHYFNAEVENGKVRFIDAQPNGSVYQKDVSYYFDFLKVKSIQYGRTDDLDLEDRWMKQSLEGKKHDESK